MNSTANNKSSLMESLNSSSSSLPDCNEQLALCLAENQRNFAKCQDEVKLLKECFKKQQLIQQQSIMVEKQ
jgi:hypothetical protein